MAMRMPVEAIARELQQLDEREREKLDALRAKVEDLLYPSGDHDEQPMYDDLTLLRFLRARNFKSTKAEAMLRKASRIWEENDYDTELRVYEPSPAFANHWARGRFGIDREGHPVFHEPLGSVDPKSLFRGLHRDELILNEIVLGQVALRVCAKLSQLHKKAITKVTVVYDLEGMSMKHFYRPFVSAYSELCELFETLYPECLSKLIVLNAPRIFPMAFAIIKPLLNETTRGKLIFGSCDRDENYQLLLEHIDKRWIPKHYGGLIDDDKAGLVFGSPFPESSWIDPKEVMANAKSITLSRGEKHVVTIGHVEEGAGLRYQVFADGSSDVLMHLDVDGVEATQRTRKVDCSLLPKSGTYLVRRSGEVHLTFENDNLFRTKVVQYNVSVITLPDSSKYVDDVIAAWEQVHMPAPGSPVVHRPRKAQEGPAPGQEERPRSYIEAANAAHALNINFSGLAASLLLTKDPMQVTAV